MKKSIEYLNKSIIGTTVVVAVVVVSLLIQLNPRA